MLSYKIILHHILISRAFSFLMAHKNKYYICLILQLPSKNLMECDMQVGFINILIKHLLST